MPRRPIKAIETSDGPIPLDRVLSLTPTDSREIPGAGLHAGDAPLPPARREPRTQIRYLDASGWRIVVEVPGTVSELLAKIAAGRVVYIPREST